MGPSKIVMFIRVPLRGMRVYRVSRSEDENGESEIAKEVCISLVLESGDVVTGCYTSEVNYWRMREPRDTDPPDFI